MILQEKNEKIERIGGGETHAFTIEVSRKAFQILSDLYSDKPLAIMRELGCNAMDSHRDADKSDLPITVHLPNALEPHLEIRDYGLGISPDDVIGIYTGYFKSTKTKSNNTVGCLGLGSKSPFCYTDNFTVTVRYNGVKRLYLAYFNEEGAPNITLASEEDDCEGNGVAIQIPVKKEDCNKFRAACLSAFRWFAVKPIITGAGVDWSEVDRKTIVKGNGWRIMEKNPNDYRSDSGSFAIMGGVNYPINKDKVRSDLQCVLVNTVMEFPIGHLDFAPSREALSYDDRTVKHLNERIEIIKKEIVVDALASINGAVYLDDAARVYTALPSFARTSIGNFSWKGNVVPAIKGGYRTLTKSSYRKNLRSSSYTSVYIDELSKTKDKSYILDKANDLWKIREDMDVKNLSSVYIFEPDTVSALISAGVNPAMFVKSSTLTYAKSASNVARQIDKEVVGMITGHTSAFESMNLRSAITNGAKYYALKNGNNTEAKIKGLAFEKRSMVNLNSQFQTTLVIVAPTKEKMAIAAGLISIEVWIDEQIATLLNSVEGQRLISLTPLETIRFRDLDKAKKIIDIALTGTSNLSMAIILSEEKTTLSKKFDLGLKIINRFESVINKTIITSVVKPSLSTLESYIMHEMSNYSSTDGLELYKDYEKLFAQAASAKKD